LTSSKIECVAGGRFAFNVPAGFLDDGDSHGSGERYPSLLSEMRAIAERDYGCGQMTERRAGPGSD